MFVIIFIFFILGFIFCLQLLVISVLVVIYIIRGFLSSDAHHHFHPLNWYLPMITSVGLAGITGLAWQIIIYCNPSKAIKLEFWFSPLLTCAMGVLLIIIGQGAGLAFRIVSILVSAIQSLYACWASPQFEHAVSVLYACSAKPLLKTIMLTVLTVISTFVYSAVLMAAVFTTIIFLSMIWTLQVIKNFLQVAVSRIKYMSFACGDETTMNTWTSFREVVGPTMGPVCCGSILVPSVRGSSRATSLTAGDSDEFLFFVY